VLSYYTQQVQIWQEEFYRKKAKKPYPNGIFCGIISNGLF